ncbi:MAG TPA: nucleotide-binding protein [Methanoregulaceae archaeon]|nr:nucleotide-binding protein [Methanoregulaceae archaeon]
MASDRHGSADRITVLFDANALMVQFQFRIDIFEELRNLIGLYDPLILADVIIELHGLARGQGRHGSAARSALILAEKCTKVESELKDGRVDEKIVDYAQRHGCMVITNDRSLRNTLLSYNIPVISLKQRKKLDIVRR